LTNPWNTISLADYEAHMALPTVGQAALIANELSRAGEAHGPASIAVLGCAGGNGLERLLGGSARRVVALDINRDYVATVEARFRGRIEGLEAIVGNVEDDAQVFDPVDLIYAALLLEYVDLGRALKFMRRHCQPAGILVVVLQLPSTEIAHITPSPYVSLRELEPIFRFVSPTELGRLAAEAGFQTMGSRIVTASGGKSFSLQEFRASHRSAATGI
jgi:SAM-dependent methyltransferase